MTENRRIFEEGLAEIMRQLPIQWPRIPRDRSVSRKQAQINADICDQRARALQEALEYANSINAAALDEPNGPDARVFLDDLWAIYAKAGLKRPQ
jgi:hypothetical protein